MNMFAAPCDSCRRVNLLQRPTAFISCLGCGATVCAAKAEPAFGQRSFTSLSRVPPGKIEASECAVCLSALGSGLVVVSLPCAHQFHEPCVVEWFSGGASQRACPLCRFKPEDVKPQATRTGFRTSTGELYVYSPTETEAGAAGSSSAAASGRGVTEEQESASGSGLSGARTCSVL